MSKFLAKYSKWMIYAFFCIAVIFIAYQTPYCHDEWKWGLPFRVELMKNGFKNYNGRYLGNFLALLITRSTLAKTMVIATGIIALLSIVEKCVCYGEKENDISKNIFCLILAILLLFSVPQTLYAQSYGWPAAFVNFVPAVILFLIYYKWTEGIYYDLNTGYTKSKMVALIPLGIATQLFSEHITIFVVLYAIWLVVYAKIRTKKFQIFHLVYLFSVIVGALIMFSNGAYHKAVSQPTSYKHISLSMEVMYEQFCRGILDNLFINNWILNTILSITLIVFIFIKKRNDLLFTEMVIVFTGYSIYSIWHRICGEWVFFADENWNVLIEMAISFLFFINVLLCIWLIVEKEKRMALCVLYVSMGIVAAPLVAANPIGARCFFVSYIFECIVVLKLIREILNEIIIDLYHFVLVAAVSACLLLVIYMRMFAMVGASDRYRENLIAEAVTRNEEQVVLPILPYSQFTWTTEPTNEEWTDYFKRFYGIPEEMEVVFQ